MVKVSPTPMESIIGTTAALLPAPNMYWMMYFPDMISDFFRGDTSSTVVRVKFRRRQKTGSSHQLYTCLTH